MNVDRKLMIVATCLTAASLAACTTSSPAAPFDPRTVSVAAPPVTLSATPTAPVTIATSDPNSHVQVTLPVGVQQQINTLAGGAATVSMTDVAPTDFGTRLPAGDAALIGSRPLTVLLFTIAKSGSAAAADLSWTRAAGISADVASTTISFSIILPTGQSCSAAAPLLVSYVGGSANPIVANITYSAGPPATITATTSSTLILNALTSVLGFICPGATVTGGTSGAN